jgi:hypothetical protein
MYLFNLIAFSCEVFYHLNIFYLNICYVSIGDELPSDYLFQ